MSYPGSETVVTYTSPLPYPTAPAQDVYFSFLTTPAWPVWDVCGEENYDNGLDPIEGDGEVGLKKNLKVSQKI